MGNLSPGDGKKSRESGATNNHQQTQSETNAGAETGKKLYLQVSILSPVDYKTNIYSEAIKDSR